MARAAGPAGATALRALERELARGWASGLTVLSGEDLYHLDAALRLLLRSVVPESADAMTLTVYSEPHASVGAVVAAARSVGMFAPRRVVLVRDAAILEGEPDAIVAYAARPPAASYLFVRAPALDRRRKLHQALVGSGRQLVFGRMAQGPLLVREVRDLAARKELQLDEGAAALLAEIAGADFYRIDTELEKLRAYAGGGRITTATLREVAAGAAGLSGWECADAVMRRERPAALAAVRRLVQGGDEPLRILGGLAFRARMLVQAKALAAAGTSPRELPHSVRWWGDPSALLQGVAAYSLPELLAFPAALLQADRTLKSRSLDPTAVLEQLVERLVQGADA